MWHESEEGLKILHFTYVTDFTPLVPEHILSFVHIALLIYSGFYIESGRGGFVFGDYCMDFFFLYHFKVDEFLP